MANPDRDDSASPVITGTSKAGRRLSRGMTRAHATPLDKESMAHQDEERHRQMRALIALGRERGYLTHADIDDYLPDNFTQSAALEAIVSTFSDMGVAVYEQEPAPETLLLNDGAAAVASDDQADEEAEAALATVDSEFGRTTDPFRMYMREMGARELLTRAGEIEIAKRVEDSLQDMIQAIAACPSIVSMILADVDRVVAGELCIDELVDGISDDTYESGTTPSLDEHDVEAHAPNGDLEGDDVEAATEDPDQANAARLEQLKNDSLAIFARVRTLFEQLTVGPDAGKARSDAVAQMRSEIRLELAPVRFTARTIDRLCASVHEQVSEVRTIERSILQIAVDRCGMPRETFVESFPGHETDLEWASHMAATSQQFSGALERHLPAIRAGQQKLIEVEAVVSLPFHEPVTVQGPCAVLAKTGGSPATQADQPPDDCRGGENAAGQAGDDRGESSSRHFDRQEIPESWHAVPGSDPGRQHRPDEGGGQI